MNVKALKAQLSDMGLPTKGKKEELEARLADAIEEEVIEEVVEEEIAEEIAEEEDSPVEEVASEETPECDCDWCMQGLNCNGTRKRPDTPSTEWDIAKYGKRPDGAYVRIDGAHLLADGKKIEE
jgi:hypothetical protein|tara:strand:+ start:2050 stop:2421 length:372 start_codon:yes stop_codon:yes gene_type:complete